MRLTEGLAEIFGMFAADGCLQEKYICLWGNITEDRDYYNDFICPLFSKVFKKKVIAHEKKSNSVYGFYVCDKDVIQIFKEAGFTKNKTYSVRVPQFILDSNNPKIYAAFIRGFTDCDGCISFMKRKGNYKEFKKKFNTYPRISIKVTSSGIIDDVSLMLKRLNLEHTKYPIKNYKDNEKAAYQIFVRGNKRVENWMKKIGFSNPSQLTKYEIWKKFGICPSKTTIEQRKLILQNKLNSFKLSKKGAPDRI